MKTRNNNPTRGSNKRSIADQAKDIKLAKQVKQAVGTKPKAKSEKIISTIDLKEKAPALVERNTQSADTSQSQKPSTLDETQIGNKLAQLEQDGLITRDEAVQFKKLLKLADQASVLIDEAPVLIDQISFGNICLDDKLLAALDDITDALAICDNICASGTKTNLLKDILDVVAFKVLQFIDKLISKHQASPPVENKTKEVVNDKIYNILDQINTLDKTRDDAFSEGDSSGNAFKYEVTAKNGRDQFKKGATVGEKLKKPQGHDSAKELAEDLNKDIDRLNSQVTKSARVKKVVIMLQSQSYLEGIESLKSVSQHNGSQFVNLFRDVTVAHVRLKCAVNELQEGRPRTAEQTRVLEGEVDSCLRDFFNKLKKAKENGSKNDIIDKALEYFRNDVF